MLEHERIRLEPCGCRLDCVTGLVLGWCDEHRPVQYQIERYGRYWAVRDQGGLVCVTLYRRGAEEVVRRLQYIDLVFREK